MTKKTLLWGGGAKAMLALELFNLKNVVIFDPYLKKINISKNVKFYNKFSDLKNIINQCSKFYVCIGNDDGQTRTYIAKKLLSYKLKPLSLIHKNSIIHKSVKFGKMVMVMPGVIINPFTKIGDFSVINTAAVVEHDCSLDEGVDIMGSASIAGFCVLKKYVTVGTGATIFPKITLNENCFVGSGSVVRKNINKNDIVVGNPSKFLKKNFQKDTRSLKTIKNLKKF
tara:strand:- start:150 stop:827 length:678 start_codon:yes stop_codon:yes gene_type:complete